CLYRIYSLMLNPIFHIFSAHVERLEVSEHKPSPSNNPTTNSHMLIAFIKFVDTNRFEGVSNASTIVFVVFAFVLMRDLPGVDGCNSTLNSRLAPSLSLAYVIAHAASVLHCFVLFHCCNLNNCLSNVKKKTQIVDSILERNYFYFLHTSYSFH
ncbi:hypothetical protein L9F63_024869, partial [Diploptera punctata]